jgi:hypothetical protein
VPLSTPAELNVTPLGSDPVSLKVGAGYPVAVTVNEPEVPTVKVALFALVIAGAWFTVKVLLVPDFPEPRAVIVTEAAPVVKVTLCGSSTPDANAPEVTGEPDSVAPAAVN